MELWARGWGCLLLLGVGFYAEKRRDVMPANAGIQGEYAIVQG